ncbi:MAG: ABC transporter ATP-binding protein, partial [Frankiales bacterium]|nr:ABC transporter ATP-binding protein [Frankiales bacterium]
MADRERHLSAGLQAALLVDRDRFRLDINLTVRPGRVLALLGPNGAGKSTALRVLAGLTALDAGRIVLDDRILDDPAAGVLLPPAHRGVGMVFQDYLLFPHLSALDNVAFGLRAGGASRRSARQAALGWLGRVGLAELAAVKPASLSGGQAQRVALARALAPAPRLLLLDEPLAALDASTTMAMRSELRRHLREVAGCSVLVTHDPLDAMVLADEVVVIEDGRVVQQGTPAEVARAPRTDYVARLVGLNLYRGVARDGVVALAGGGTLTTADSRTGEVFVAFRPSAVVLHHSRPVGLSARNLWPASVVGLERHADTVRVQLDGAPPLLADVTTAAV